MTVGKSCFIKGHQLGPHSNLIRLRGSRNVGCNVSRRDRKLSNEDEVCNA